MLGPLTALVAVPGECGMVQFRVAIVRNTEVVYSTVLLDAIPAPITGVLGDYQSVWTPLTVPGDNWLTVTHCPTRRAINPPGKFAYPSSSCPFSSSCAASPNARDMACSGQPRPARPAPALNAPQAKGRGASPELATTARLRLRAPSNQNWLPFRPALI